MFQTAVLINKVSTLVDGGLSIQLHTQELNQDEMSKIFGLRGKSIWACFKETEVREQDLDIPESIPQFEGDKSPSQRLRDRMYVYFKGIHGEKDEGFRQWYEQALEIIGQTYLDKLNP